MTTAAIRLDYFYGTEDRMCSFYRIPKAFEKCEAYRNVSLEIKYLYSIMLDRVSISARNGWLDAGRVFIYFSLSEVVKCIQAGRTKAVQVLHEMEKIGLIQRKKQGQGKPARIFVRNIIEQDTESTVKTENMETQEITVQEAETPDTDRDTPGETTDREPMDPQTDPGLAAQNEDGKLEQREPTEQDTKHNPADPASNADRSHPFGVDCAQMTVPADTIHATDTAAVLPAESRTFGFRQSRGSDSETLDCRNLNPNYNNKNQTEWNHTQSIYPDSSASSFRHDSRIGAGQIERMEARERIRTQMDYSILTLENPEDIPEIDRYVDLMTEVICSRRDTIRINGCLLPLSVVRERFQELNRMHLLYVLECMRNNQKEVINIRAYMLTALYNAPDTMDAYYDMQVRRDMVGW